MRETRAVAEPSSDASTSLVTSAAHPVVKRIRRLRMRKHRQAEHATAVFGIQPVWFAVESGARIEVVVLSPDLLTNANALAMVADLEAAGSRVVRVAADLLAKLEERDGPSGLAAIVAYDVGDLADLDLSGAATVVALHQVSNPGNLGTILRTADASGAAGVVLVGPTADPADPAAVKASMGAVFTLPVARVADLDAFFDWARASGVSVATTSGRAPQSLWEAEPTYPLAVLMGNEGAGLDDGDVARGDLQLTIPMVGTAESLNLAVATGVVLYELWRRRSATGPSA